MPNLSVVNTSLRYFPNPHIPCGPFEVPPRYLTSFYAEDILYKIVEIEIPGWLPAYSEIKIESRDFKVEREVNTRSSLLTENVEEKLKDGKQVGRR